MRMEDVDKNVDVGRWTLDVGRLLEEALRLPNLPLGR